MNIHDLGLHGLISGGGSIKSIQSGVIALGNSISTGAASISTVDPSKSVALITSGIHSNGSTTSIAPYHCTIEITDANNITIQRGYPDGDVTIRWCVIEFNGVKSKQNGLITPSESKKDAFVIPITTVDIAKCLVIGNTRHGAINGQATETRGSTTEVYLSATNQLTVYGYGYSWITTSWQVIEFL